MTAVGRHPASDSALTECLDWYDRARDRLRRVETDVAEGRAEPGEHLRAAEEVLRARLALRHRMLEEGWVLPPHLMREIEVDEALTHEANGAAER